MAFEKMGMMAAMEETATVVAVKKTVTMVAVKEMATVVEDLQRNDSLQEKTDLKKINRSK